MFANSMHRVQDHTAPDINERIHDEMEYRLGYFRHHPEKIADRLQQLDEEWDIECALETASSSVSLAGFSLAILTRKKRYLVLPLIVQSFFLQHALQGWCPPLPLFRRLGFRTQQEIEQEREALVAMRS